MTHRTGSRAGSRRERNGGFTLIELLVALTLLGVTTMFLFGGFRLGTRAWEASSQRIDGLGQIEGVQSLLRLQLGQAEGLLLEGPASQPEPAFSGSATQVRFTAPLPVHRGIGGIYMFWLGLGDAGSGKALMLQRRIFRPDMSADGRDSDATDVLLRRVESLDIAYYGAIGQETEASWHDAWASQDTQPALIRLIVRFAAGDERVWPDFVVAPKPERTGP